MVRCIWILLEILERGSSHRVNSSNWTFIIGRKLILMVFYILWSKYLNFKWSFISSELKVSGSPVFSFFEYEWNWGCVLIRVFHLRKSQPDSWLLYNLPARYYETVFGRRYIVELNLHFGKSPCGSWSSCTLLLSFMESDLGIFSGQGYRHYSFWQNHQNEPRSIQFHSSQILPFVLHFDFIHHDIIDKLDLTRLFVLILYICGFIWHIIVGWFFVLHHGSLLFGFLLIDTKEYCYISSSVWFCTASSLTADFFNLLP